MAEDSGGTLSTQEGPSKAFGKLGNDLGGTRLIDGR